jgi:hypothetical protein
MLTELYPNPNQVIVSTEEWACCPVPSTCAHHRDFPEIRAEGATPWSAAAILADRLTSARDCAGGGWRRAQIEHAIEDVKAFVAQES